jgi:hypothetical protein
MKLEMGTVSEVEVEGTVNPVTDGGLVSESVITVVALLPVETLPDVSLAQAYKVLVPAVVNV